MAYVVDMGSETNANLIHIVYDMEMVGNVHDFHSCHVWNLAAVNFLDTGKRFSRYILPPLARLPPPPHPDLFPVTKKYLTEKKAVAWSVAGPEFLNWVLSQRLNDETRVVLVSHGNFTFDKPMLEIEFGRVNIVIPKVVFFMDTLPVFRSHLRSMQSYSLKAIHQKYIGEPIEHQHLAENDVDALHRILIKLCREKGHGIQRLSAIYYPAYYTPLAVVNGIGAYNESLLVKGGVPSVDYLKIAFVHRCRLDVDSMQTYLEQTFHLSRTSAIQITGSLLQMTLAGI